MTDLLYFVLVYLATLAAGALIATAVWMKR